MFNLKIFVVLLLLLIAGLVSPKVNEELYQPFLYQSQHDLDIFNSSIYTSRNYKNPCPTFSIAFFALSLVEVWVSYLKDLPQLQALDVFASNFVNSFNGSLCNQILLEDTCSDDVRIFVKTQTKKCLNVTALNTLLENIPKNINLTSINIDKPLNQCFVDFVFSYYDFFIELLDYHKQEFKK